MTKTEKQWHALPVEDVIAELETDEKGLSDSEAEKRLDQYGENRIGDAKGVSAFEVILQQIKNPLIYVLFGAAILSFVVGHILDAYVILGIIFINTAIGFFQEYRAEKAMEALQELAAPKAMVIRGGESREIETEKLVPGDVIQLATGDSVPADARLIETRHVKAEEAALTGESVSTDKSIKPVEEDAAVADRSCMVFAGTVITGGRASAVVTSTGSSTQVGKIAEDVAAVGHEVTPLQRQLDGVGRLLAVLAISMAAIIMAAGLIRGFEFYEILLFAAAAGVSAIPEGLPAVVTVALAIGLQRMAARNAIIRRLPAVETLGSATVICSDKTGTLTKNEMTVRVVATLDTRFEVTGEGYAPDGKIQVDGQGISPDDDEKLHTLLRAVVLCNDAGIREENGAHVASGDPTEAALITLAAKAGLGREELEEKEPRKDELPFSSDQGYMATLNEGEGNSIVYVKGAPEKVLAMCSGVMSGDGTEDISDEHRSKVDEINKDMASDALRVLAVAYRETTSDTQEISSEDLDGQLVFIGLVGMIDPPRPEAIEAIKDCQKAGITVIMATGDNRNTARAIALDMGILKNGDDGVMEGRDVEQMSEDDLAEWLKDGRVFARVSPQHKLRIVNALRKLDNIVAMTGDGVNDAPALKQADIGVAMGITGTDVAKEASDMVLTDDNFVSIVNAVEQGRIIYRNIKKVVTFLLSTNSGEMLIILSTILLGMPLPLVPVQILWINLITDTFPGLSLAADTATEDVLKDHPRDPRQRFITRGMIYRLILVALVMTIGTVILFWWHHQENGLDKARTVAFATMSVFQLFNAFNVRSNTQSVFKTSLRSSNWFVAAITTSLVLQIGAVHLPFMQTLFHTVHLTLTEWLVIIAVSSSVMWAEEIRKKIAPDLVN